MPNVRVFGYSSTVQLPQRQTKHFTSESQFTREEPYLWSQKLALNGATPVETAVVGSDMARFVVIEVDGGAAVRYELNPQAANPATHRNASTLSPRLAGENLFQWFGGATLSFVDASAV